MVSTAYCPTPTASEATKQLPKWIKEIRLMELIKFFEGYSETAYQDTGGVWTIGYGSTKGVKEGDKITLEQANELLKKDLIDAEMRVKNATQNIILTTNEYQALVSLAYNLRSFEKLASYLPDREKFKKKMLLYSSDIKGNPLKGLKIRRICERLLFEGKEWRGIAKEMQRSDLAYIREQEKELFV